MDIYKCKMYIMSSTNVLGHEAEKVLSAMSTSVFYMHIPIIQYNTTKIIDEVWQQYANVKRELQTHKFEYKKSYTMNINDLIMHTNQAFKKHLMALNGKVNT